MNSDLAPEQLRVAPFVRPTLLPSLPEGGRIKNLLGVDYCHLKTEDGGDLYLTVFGMPFWKNLLPENWFSRDWFRENRVRLEGTSTVYRTPTRSVDGASLDLVVKFSRVGESVPIDTLTVNKFIKAEFNSPFEEFSLLMELRKGAFGPPGIQVRTQRPLAIYVPSKRMQLWQTGRSESKIRSKIARHPGVEIDILRQYVLLFGWVKGLDAVEAADTLNLKAARRERFISQMNSLAIHELAQKGYQVVDMKPQHVILRPRRKDGTLLRDRSQQYAYALIDYELLQRTPEHEEAVRNETRRFYISHMEHRFDEPGDTPLPAHLHRVKILGVDYIFGHTESTGGSLWVVGKDPALFNYFLPERWRRTPKRLLADRNDVNYTCTKDGVHIVWRVSRMGDLLQDNDSERRCYAVLEHGFNSPFEEVTLALWLRKNGLLCIPPRAIYMTGSKRSEEVEDERRYRAMSGLHTPDGDPLLRRDHDYITIYGYWRGERDTVAIENAERNRPVNGEEAVDAGFVEQSLVNSALLATARQLESLSLEALHLKPDHLLFVVDSDDRIICDEHGDPEIRLCNLELIKSRISDELAVPSEIDKIVL